MRPTVGFGFLLRAVSSLTLATFGLFALPVAETLGVETIALAFGLFSFVSGFAAPIVGILVDRLGLRLVQRTGAILLVVGLFACASATSVWHYYVGMGLFCAVGVTAFTQLPVNVLVTQNVVGRVLPAFGLVTAGAGLGALVTIPLTERAISAYGWRPSYAVYAVATLGVWIVFDRWLRRAGIQTPPAKDEPEVSPVDASGPLVVRQEAQVVLAAGFSGAQRTLIVAFFIPWSISRGYSVSTAAQVFGIAEGLRAFSGIGVAWIGQRFGSRVTYVVTTTTAAACVAMLLLADPGSPVLYYIAAGLYGVASGGIHPSSSSLQSQVYRRERLGTLFGSSTAAYGIGGAAAVGMATSVQLSFGLDGVMWLIAIGLLAMAILIVGVAKNPPAAHQLNV